MVVAPFVLCLSLWVLVQGEEGLPWVHPYMLGRGFDLSTINLWDYSAGADHKDVFSIGPNLFVCAERDKDCTKTSEVTVSHFKSVQDVVAGVLSDHSMNVGIDIHATNVGISAATQSQSHDRWFSDVVGTLGLAQNKQRCHSLVSECFRGSGIVELNPDFKNALDDLPVNYTGLDEEVLSTYRSNILAVHGTHICHRTDNGAMMKRFASIEASGESQAECLFAEMCVTLKAMGFSAASCDNQKSCSVAKQFDSMYHHVCSALGGGEGFIATSLCQPTSSVADRWKFLNSGDLDDARSVIQMYFTPLDEVARWYDYDEQKVNTLKKAIEYHQCVDSPVWAWDTSSGTGQCKCIRRCENGGVLDPNTCTCKCRSDLHHGWTGSDCTETFGTCQPGLGTGNPRAAGKCIYQNGYCSSADAGVTRTMCQATDVCCLTDFKGRCCPFGSRCSCGSNDCQCVFNNLTSIGLDQYV